MGPHRAMDLGPGADGNLRAALSTELGTRCGPSSGILQTDRFINGLKGGLLADESGLGKKVQVIAFLVYLKDRFSTPGPHLVAPWTLLFDAWKKASSSCGGNLKRTQVVVKLLVDLVTRESADKWYLQCHLSCFLLKFHFNAGC